MLNTSMAPWPCFTDEEADAVRAVIMSNRVNYWTGEEGRQFEREFAAWVGTSHAIAVANGTLALDLCLQGLGIGSAYGGSADDEVIVTPRTFMASISCVVNAGAIPVFADVDHDSGNISAATIGERVTAKTKAVIPVHLAGWPCDMDAIMELANSYDFKVIEDCAQAHGAKCNGRSVGALGHVAAWSFCQDKIMTTGGEGGMVTCNDQSLWSRMWSFKDHGKSWDAVYNRQHPLGFRWVHESFGTNWRMLEMQAAIGRIQLRRMSDWTARRSEIAYYLRNALDSVGNAVRTPLPTDEFVHAFYRLYAFVRPEGLRDGWDRDRIVSECVKNGAPVLQGSCSEAYLETAFDNSGWRPSQRLPIAQELGETSLMFLTHPTISDEELHRYCSTISEVFSRATR
ncbi:MAG: DegT/DnrJ/EryC1/StrS aminotransferase family protein [Sphingopyxis sp.]